MSDFAAACKKNEIDIFFKGQGEYFKLDRECGGHSFAMNMFSIFIDIDESKYTTTELEECFSKFISELEKNDSDLNVFFENAYAFYACFYRLSSKLDKNKFNDIFSKNPCRIETIKFLSNYRSSFNNNIATKIKEHFPNSALSSLI